MKTFLVSLCVLLKPVDYLFGLFNATRLWISWWGGIFCEYKVQGCDLGCTFSSDL